MRDRELTVLKFGGSVLRSTEDLHTAVHEVYRWLRAGGKVVVVVSAFEGTTDRLIAQGQEVDPRPDPVATALLLATGELTTAALVVLALQRAGVPATVLNPAAAGLRTDGAGTNANPVSVDHDAVWRALADHSVVVVPGFVGVDEHSQYTLLGRGGSDLTALFLASELGATRCRLIKDVDGLYESDPALPGPRPRRYERISWDAALSLDEGIVQHKALRFAKGVGLSFEVGAFNRPDATVVGEEETRLVRGREETQPLRVLLLGLGVVGLGVYRSLRALPEHFQVVGVLCRDRAKALAADVDEGVISTDAASVLDVEADVVVELLGGLDAAAVAVRRSLQSGRSVVTANKALMSRDGVALAAVAAGTGATLVYSAAVGGSVPMVEAVQSLAEGGIVRVEGVLNGTTNYVLNECGAGKGFDEAVAGAQRAGFAEADPSRDLSGTDAAEKLAILIRHAFGVEVSLNEISKLAVSTAVIERVRSETVDGLRLRHIAWAERDELGVVSAGIELRAVAAQTVFANLPGATNKLVVTTKEGDCVTIQGAGAGRWPTAESVVADLLDLHRASGNIEVSATKEYADVIG